MESFLMQMAISTKESGWQTGLKGLGHIRMSRDFVILVSGSRIREKGLGKKPEGTQSMKEHLKKDKRMEKEKCSFLMEAHTKENFTKTRYRARVF
jgi:hypothetical protein